MLITVGSTLCICGDVVIVASELLIFIVDLLGHLHSAHAVEGFLPRLCEPTNDS